MLKKISTMMMLCLCGTLLTVSTLSAQDNTSNVPVGTRMLPLDEHIAQQQSRARLSALDVQEDGQIKADAEGYEEEKVAQHDLYYTSHPGAYHPIYKVGIGGSSIELADGSIWSVCSGDTYKTLNWLVNDTVVITPNRSWFSSYDFRITNQNTGVSIQAKMTLGPLYNAPLSHWIVGIDEYSGLVYLEDGTIWTMSCFDSSVYRKWVINDTVIIGINDGWLSYSNPNILINVNMLNYAKGVVVH